MSGRRKGREYALQMLFQWDLSKESFKKVSSLFWTLNEGVGVQTKAFADHLTAGTVRHINQIDILLARHAEHWRISRMAVVDRNIVRIAGYIIGGIASGLSVVFVRNILKMKK